MNNMSTLENDKIFDSALERAEKEGVDLDALSELDIEHIYEYLQTGDLPDSYQQILYRLYKL